MRQFLPAVLALSIASCASKFPDSQCTSAPIQVVKSTAIELPITLNAPFFQMSHKNVEITLSEADVYLILEERKATSARVAEAIGALKQNFAQLADSPKPITEAQVKPEISIQRSEAQAKEMSIGYEIDALFFLALRSGKALVELSGRPVSSVEMQHYTASKSSWVTNGVRFMYKTSPVYDFCSVKPPAISN